MEGSFDQEEHRRSLIMPSDPGIEFRSVLVGAVAGGHGERSDLEIPTCLCVSQLASAVTVVSLPDSMAAICSGAFLGEWVLELVSTAEACRASLMQARFRKTASSAPLCSFPNL